MDSAMFFSVFYRKVDFKCLLLVLSALISTTLVVPAAAVQRYSYALEQCDPVSYQVSGRPLMGDEAYNVSWGGRIWAFVNEGNKQAFLRDPEVYAPLFRGCDAMSLAQGYRAQGLVKVYLIYKQRLLLFQSRENRSLFLSAPDAILEKAQGHADAVNCGPYR